jgi:YD repeat-containing protein
VDALRVEVSPSHDVTLTIGGQRKTFYFTPQGSIFGWYTPAYSAQSGLYGKLVNTGDTCAGVLLRVGNIWRCGILNDMYSANGWKYTDPAGREYTIGGDRKLKNLRDLNGNSLTIAADGVTSSAGNLKIAFTRDTQGRITKITDPLGKEYLYGYNALGELATVTYPSVATAAQYTYDPVHLLKTYQDPRGNTAASTVYDAAGRLQSVTDIDGTISYAYNTVARTTTITNPDTGVEVIETDVQGNVVRKVDGLNRTTTYTFDSNNNMLTETNPLNKTWTYTYDTNGFRTSVKNPLNQTDTVVYNAYGAPTSVTNALSQTQTVTYDASYRVNTITDSIGQIAQFTWNPQGLPLTMKDARGNTSSYTYDSYGNRTSHVDPEGRTTNTTYNAFGQKLTETDARGNKTTYA